jgi:5'-nucleotidase
MNPNQRPLILFTNDDGIRSPGLWAAAEAFVGLADLLIAAPSEQQTSSGRSFPSHLDGRLYAEEVIVGGETLTAYAVVGSPAQTVQHAIHELADRTPALVVAGINYGENLGSGITISGTVGAALEAACYGIPALAVSLQTPAELHLSHSDAVDFSGAAYFTRLLGERLLQTDRPDDVDFLKVDVPQRATPETPWRVTRVSRHRLYRPVVPERATLSDAGRMGYQHFDDYSWTEPDSDIYAIYQDEVVSVTPMSFDLTARTDRAMLAQLLASDSP